MMDAPAWSRVKAVIESALERTPGERAAFVRQACGNDSALRAEVESLLAAMEQTGSFVEGPALHSLASSDAVAAARMLDAAGRALQRGDAVGPYTILGLVGAGGMGEVYRARDTKLRREVAIKILPDAFALDPDRVARFQREAELLAALNHPNIATVYGVEESGGVSAIVMELVEGETLAETLAAASTQGLPMDEALIIARQIADALEAAHERGVIHRDLKPANIKITRERRVKVLDFGLAKMAETGAAATAGEADAAPGFSPVNATTMPATHAGVILGTAAYMSPEQARGKPVDRRTDIWAFGCVVYEMLAGKKAFAVGETISDAIATILKGDIDWDALPAATPVHVRTLLRRCLQKDPQKRLPHIGVARLEIEEGALEPATTPPASAAPLRPARLWKRAASIVTGAMVVGALAATAAWRLKPQPAAMVARFTIALPPDQTFTNPGRHMLALSPDGTQILYVANRRLNIRALGDSEPRPIAGTNDDDSAMQPVFSPDGRSVAFGTVQGVKRLPVTGGTAVTICPIRGGIHGMSWTGDQIVFGEGSTRILRVPAAGGTPEVLVSVTPPEAVASPQLLPDGDHLLFTHARLAEAAERWDKAQIVVQSLKTGERRTIVDAGADGRYLPSGHLTYAIGGVVYGVPFEVSRLAIRGTPEPMIDGVRRGGPTGAAQFAVSTTGSLAYLPGTPSSSRETELFLSDAKGNPTRLNVRGGQYEQPRLSPDGRYVAFSSTSSLDSKEGIVWVYELSGASAMRRLTIGGNNRFPVWSADGQRVAFQSDRERDLGVFWQRADGTGTAERLTRPDQGTAHIPHAASPDGRHLLYTVMKGAAATLWAYSFPDRTTTQLAGVTSTNALAASFSPDGRWITYEAGQGAGQRSRVYVEPFPPNGTRYEVGIGNHPAWSADGRQLIMPRSPSRMGVITLNMQPTFTFSDSVEANVKIIAAAAASVPRAFDIGRDGRMVGAVTAGMLDASGGRTEIRVVLNWFEEVKWKVGSGPGTEEH